MTYTVAKLKAGRTYRDVLTGRTVLVLHKYGAGMRATGVVANPATGHQERIDLCDHQLTTIKRR